MGRGVSRDLLDSVLVFQSVQLDCSPPRPKQIRSDRHQHNSPFSVCKLRPESFSIRAECGKFPTRFTLVAMSTQKARALRG